MAPCPTPADFLYSPFTVRGLVNKLQPVLALEEVREHRLRLGIGWSSAPHPLHLKRIYSCQRRVPSKAKTGNFRFSMANGQW